MKRHNLQLVDGLLDGELHGWRRWRARRHVSKCPLCALEYRHQTHVRQLLAAHPPTAAMPESADAFWAGVRAAVESPPARSPSRALEEIRTALADWLFGRPAFVPALAVAVIVILGGILWLRTGRPTAPSAGPIVVEQTVRPAPVAVKYAAVERVETRFRNTVATAFEADDGDVSVIWLSGLPWTKSMTEMQTVFAHPDEYLDI